jgi:hypothetical protein
MLGIEDPTQFTLHVACWNGNEQPMDVSMRDTTEWFAWSRQAIEEEELHRKHVLSIIDIYHETDSWLFGGVFRLIERDQTLYDSGLVIVEASEYHGLVGRIKVRMPRPPRGRTYRLERLLRSMEVARILPEPYGGKGIETP